MYSQWAPKGRRSANRSCLTSVIHFQMETGRANSQEKAWVESLSEWGPIYSIHWNLLLLNAGATSKFSSSDLCWHTVQCSWLHKHNQIHFYAFYQPGFSYHSTGKALSITTFMGLIVTIKNYSFKVLLPFFPVTFLIVDVHCHFSEIYDLPFSSHSIDYQSKEKMSPAMTFRNRKM